MLKQTVDRLQGLAKKEIRNIKWHKRMQNISLLAQSVDKILSQVGQHPGGEEAEDGVVCLAGNDAV